MDLQLAVDPYKRCVFFEMEAWIDFQTGFSLRVKVHVFTYSETKAHLQLLCLPC